MFGDGEVLSPMFATEEIGEAPDGEMVKIRKVGDTGKFMVKHGDETVRTIRFDEPAGEEYIEKRGEAIGYARCYLAMVGEE